MHINLTSFPCLNLALKFLCLDTLTLTGGGTRSGKVRVCEAGPPDPLHPPVHEFVKNIPPPVRSAVQHVPNSRPPPVQGRDHPPRTK